MGGHLESWTTYDDDIYWRLKLTKADATRMDREQLEMIQDGLWLIERGLKGQTEGPLNTPRLDLPVRTAMPLRRASRDTRIDGVDFEGYAILHGQAAAERAFGVDTSIDGIVKGDK